MKSLSHRKPFESNLRTLVLGTDRNVSGAAMDSISWSDLNPGEQRAIALLGAGMSIDLCDSAALVTIRRAGLVRGSSLTLKAEKLRRSAVLKALAA
jgi:hypothetical protein